MTKEGKGFFGARKSGPSRGYGYSGFKDGGRVEAMEESEEVKTVKLLAKRMTLTAKSTFFFHSGVRKEGR